MGFYVCLKFDGNVHSKEILLIYSRISHTAHSSVQRNVDLKNCQLSSGLS